MRRREKAAAECYALGDTHTWTTKETVMDSITLKNFRCFREEQTARLAPLTLLVGENSTGKTSFMAMIRALWDQCYLGRIPDFKEEPYDLGSFDEIAHHRGRRGSRAVSFEAGFEDDPKNTRELRKKIDVKAHPYRFDVAFEKNGSAPVQGKMRFTCENSWLELRRNGESLEFNFGTAGGEWKTLDISQNQIDDELSWIISLSVTIPKIVYREDALESIRPQGVEQLTDEELQQIQKLGGILSVILFSHGKKRPYASSPVRSKPRRTYDPARPTPDPEGDYIPMHLAHLSHHDPKRWNRLKEALEDFGKEAGLFDEIDIRHLGKRDSEPFQMQVRKSGRKLKGPRRNLIDVGYGVSQVLPVITELLEKDAPPMFLLQQPEVHLHPSAQAALGSLFCEVATTGKQLVVETHGDHLLSRVRMDVRDGKTKLKPEDVSILFFERDDLDVRIHSIRLDEEGNVLGAPPTYRKFFMEETRRSLWKR